jgi:TonB family protein
MKLMITGVMALLLTSGSAVAQSTEADISARLLGKPLQLRGFWMDDQLRFDATGTPAKAYKTGSFTESAFEARKVELHGSQLEIEGERMGLLSNQDDMDQDGGMLLDRVILTKKSKKVETIKIQIDGGAGADFTQALDAVFAASLADLAPNVPAYWQTYFHKEVLHEQAPPTAGGAKPFKKGGNMQPPKVLKSVNPSFSETARGQKTSGHTLVTLVVDADGMPQNVQVSQPAGLGLDEQAVKAVSQYRFRPAMKDGAPVKVELTVEVNFQIL